MVATSLRRRRSVVYILLVFVSTGTGLISLLPQQSEYYRALSDSLTVGQAGLRGSGVAKAKNVPRQIPGDDRMRADESFDLDRLRDPSDTCFYVEDLCVGSNRLFYRTDQSKQQPDFNLNLYVSATTCALPNFPMLLRLAY